MVALRLNPDRAVAGYDRSVDDIAGVECEVGLG